MDLIDLCERGLVPDFLTRFGMRRVIARRLHKELAGDEQEHERRFDAMLAELKNSPVALNTNAANDQHYEVPPEFFIRTLGPRLKYSACYWPTKDTTLARAEEEMLRLTCERAAIQNGDHILELGCGWGSLTLWMASQFPDSTIVAVSNSSSQRKLILQRARTGGFRNVQVITADMNDFDTDARFDRVVSVEMFEHMRNYQMLLSRIAKWLTPDGTLFVHIFCHDKVMYPFEARDREDWMARYFFTGGIMPARHTLSCFQDDMKLENSWDINGKHYSRTLYAWLERQDAAREEIMPLFEDTYGKAGARLWFQRWRMFFMACGEFFATDDGKQWYIAHYLMSKR